MIEEAYRLKPTTISGAKRCYENRLTVTKDKRKERPRYRDEDGVRTSQKGESQGGSQYLKDKRCLKEGVTILKTKAP